MSRRVLGAGAAVLLATALAVYGVSGLLRVRAMHREIEAAERDIEALRTQVVPKLFERVKPGEAIRVWVPACATGEEAYTIAMILRELGADVPAHSDPIEWERANSLRIAQAGRGNGR